MHFNAVTKTFKFASKDVIKEFFNFLLKDDSNLPQIPSFITVYSTYDSTPEISNLFAKYIMTYTFKTKDLSLVKSTLKSLSPTAEIYDFTTKILKELLLNLTLQTYQTAITILTKTCLILESTESIKSLAEFLSNNDDY